MRIWMEVKSFRYTKKWKFMCDGTDTAGPKVTTEQARSIGDHFLMVNGFFNGLTSTESWEMWQSMQNKSLTSKISLIKIFFYTKTNLITASHKGTWD